MNEQIEILEKERTELKTRVSKIDKAISALRDVCTHKHPDGSDAMKYYGHDSHKDYYKCEICGQEMGL
mgnify:CR=1 FL=1